MERTKLTSRPLAEVGLPRGVLVAAVRRGDRLLLPTGADRVAPGDQVLVITTTEKASRLDEFLSAG
jgi:trk system potassium uptake protein TrkA